MWPWEHLAVGYVAYSLGKRSVGAPPPARDEVVVLAVATQLPDLVDKPLGWGTTVLPSGVSLAHSYLVAVPLVVLVAAVARYAGRAQLGYAFGTGYLLHTPADVLATYLLDGYLFLGAFLWPLAHVPPRDTQPLLGRVGELLVEYVAVLGTPAGFAYLAIEIAVLGTAFVLWWVDRQSRRAGRVTPNIAK